MEMQENYKLNILLIDDNEEDYLVIKRTIKKINFPCKVSWCDSGEMCLRFLKKCSKNKENCILPNIILLGINMPGLNGKQILEKIKNNKDFCFIPVLMFTTSANLNPKEIKECYSLGANSYIQKPHSYEDLLEVFRAIDKYWLDVNALPNFI